MGCSINSLSRIKSDQKMVKLVRRDFHSFMYCTNIFSARYVLGTKALEIQRWQITQSFLGKTLHTAEKQLYRVYVQNEVGT